MYDKMYQSTTPTLIFNIINEELDLNEISICHLTIESENGRERKIFENTQIDVENKKITVNLTQEDTMLFHVGNIKLQLKAKLGNGQVIVSKIIKTTMNEVLEEEYL